MGRRGRPRGPYRVGDEDDVRVVSAAGRALEEQRRRLEGDGRVKVAALIGSEFGLDPVTLLQETDPLKRLVRLAAYNVVQHEANAAAKRAENSR